MVIAVGIPAATSCAKDGPLSAPTGKVKSGVGNAAPDHLRHSQEGVIFQALGRAHNDLIAPQMRPKLGDRWT